MTRMDSSARTLDRLRWVLPALFLVATVGYEIFEIFVLELSPTIEPRNLIEAVLFVLLCVLLWLVLSQLHRSMLAQEKATAELRHRNRELAVLSGVGIALAQEKKEEAIFSTALDSVAEALSARGGRLYLWDEQRNALILQAESGCCTHTECMVPEEGLSLEENARTSQETVYFEPLPTTEERDSPPCSWAAVPFISSGRSIGVLTLCLAAPVSSEDRIIFDALGHQIGTRLETALLMRRASRRTARIAALGDVARGLVTITDPDKLIHHIWEDLQQVIDFDQGMFYRYGTDPERLEPVVWKGFTAEEAQEIAHSALERHPGWVARNRQPVLAGDVDTDEHTRYLRVTRRSSSCLHVPVLDGKRCLGVIGLGSNQKYAFSNEDLAVVTAFADHAAVTMRNAEIFQETRTIKEQWEAVFNAISDGISIHDREFRIVQANQAMADLLGRPREEIIGQTCYQLFHECDAPVASCPMVKTLDSATPATLEIEETFLEGTFQVTTYPVMNNKDKPVGGVHIVHDMTDEKRIKQQMMQMEKLSAIGELVSGVAHELNNPLTAILGYAQLLQTPNLDERALQNLQRIERQAQRSAKIIQNLLTFARQHEPEREWEDINDLLLRTVSLKVYEMRTENIETITELSPRLPQLLVDPYQVQQIILNIINNAHQAMTEAHQGDKIVLRTEVREEKDGTWVRISIYDNGPDIPPATLRRIFDPFFTTKEVGKGTGLGLSISYGIVQEHGGKIWAESPPGEGPTFYIELPVQKGQKEERADTFVQQEDLSSVSAGQRILIVEDEDSLRTLLDESLSKDGHNVDTAINGVEAMHQMVIHTYDYIISDIKMPGMGGVDLYRWALKNRPALAKRMVFITGDLVNPTTKEFLEQAGQPYLSKPFVVQELYGLLERNRSAHPESATNYTNLHEKRYLLNNPW